MSCYLLPLSKETETMILYLMTPMVALFLLSGCALKPVASTQTSNNLIISLSGASNNAFFLVDKNGAKLAKDDAKDQQLSFQIPSYTDTQSCVSVTDKEGKKLQDKWYSLPLINKFRQVDIYKSHLEHRLTLQRQQHSVINKNFQNVKIKLEGHSAFSDRRCHLPTQKPIPPMPFTRCNSYNECLEEGGAICYSRFIGTEGCSLALKELNISGMLSSPGCSAVAARIAGDKYEMDDAFVDLLHGAADDVGSGLIKSDSWFDNAIGFLVLGTNYAVKLDKARICTDQFVQRYYGPKMVWRESVKQIKLQPQKIKANCENLIVAHNRYYQQLISANRNLRDLNTKLVDLSVVHDELKSREVTSPVCENNQSYNAFPRIATVKRYLIGAGIESVKGENDDLQVKITSLQKNSPAVLSGVKIGDIILSVNNTPVKSLLGFIREIQRSQGQSLLLLVNRNNKLQSINIVPSHKRIALSD